jgi:integrase
LFLKVSDSKLKKMNSENEHRNEHRFDNPSLDFSLKKRYSIPKVYIPKTQGSPDLEKRWHVYFYWRTHKDGILDKKFTYTKGINRVKTLGERKKAATALKDAVHVILERGFNPTQKSIVKATSDFSISEALDRALLIKSKTRKQPTIDGYEFHLNRFKNWLEKNGYAGMGCDAFGIDEFYEYLDYIRFDYKMENGEGLSGTSVNNHRRNLSAFFTTLKNERLIRHNFVKGIPNVDQDPENNRAFSSHDMKKIKTYLVGNDPYLIHFISFLIYPILRVREICRLKVKDINTEQWILNVETKTDKNSTRRIIEKIKPTIEAMELSNHLPDHDLFTNKNRPRNWDEATLKSKVDYFGKRFGKVKKALGYGREYGLYSFRHTAILDLYNSLVDEGMSEQEILFKLMPITQHKSIAGLKNYLRNHKKSLPQDHSDIYTIDF